MGTSTSSAMISVVQMRADQLHKEFQEHQGCISSDRMVWSMVSMEKGGNGGDRNSLRGKLYDKYMEKRGARLRMEQRSKRAAMNEAKLKALHDDLERCRMELQGMVVSSRVAGLGDRQRLQKFQSINVWSSQMTEELRQIDILRPEKDDDLTKYFCQREKMESRASARDELLSISRCHKPRKDSLVRNRPSSSLAQPIDLPVPRPSNKLTRSSSSRQGSKPENPLQLRKVNAKPPPVISRKTNHSSHGNLSFNTDNVENKVKMASLAMRLDEEESNRGLLENFSKSIDLDPFTRNASEANSGKTTSVRLEKEQDFGSLAVGVDSAGYSSYAFIKEDSIRIGHSTVATEGPKDSATEKAHEDCFGVNVVNPRSSQESDDSGNFESTDEESSRSLSCVELSMNTASELPNSTILKNFGVFGTKSLNGIPTTCETAPAAGDVQFPEADASQIQRNMWNPPMSVPPSANSSYGQSQRGLSKGLKRFLKFCKRSQGNESSADWESIMTSEKDEEIFTKSLVLEEQVPSLHFSIPSPLERIKQKDGYLSRKSLKEGTTEIPDNRLPENESQGWLDFKNNSAGVFVSSLWGLIRGLG